MFKFDCFRSSNNNSFNSKFWILLNFNFFVTLFWSTTQIVPTKKLTDSNRQFILQFTMTSWINHHNSLKIWNWKYIDFEFVYDSKLCVRCSCKRSFSLNGKIISDKIQKQKSEFNKFWFMVDLRRAIYYIIRQTEFALF